MADVSTIYSAGESTLATAARQKAADATAHFKFAVDTPDVPLIKEGHEIWAGWWDGGWLRTPRPYGGFIMQQVGYSVGATHHIVCTLASYPVLLGRATVLGWPTGEDAAAIPTAGFPGGWSVADWLAGDGSTTPYPGVVRQYLPGVDLSGIDPLFSTLIWTEANKPGTPDPDFLLIGQWGTTTLDKILQDFVGGVRVVWPDVEPIYWLDSVAAGSAVRPRFNFVDKRGTTARRKGRFSVSPAPGEYWIE